MLATEMFKVYRNITPPIFRKIFLRSDINYYSQSNSEFAVPNVRSAFHRSENTSYLGPKFWDIVPLDAFKKGIKKLEAEKLSM